MVEGFVEKEPSSLPKLLYPRAMPSVSFLLLSNFTHTLALPDVPRVVSNIAPQTSMDVGLKMKSSVHGSVLLCMKRSQRSEPTLIRSPLVKRIVWYPSAAETAAFPEAVTVLPLASAMVEPVSGAWINSATSSHRGSFNPIGQCYCRIVLSSSKCLHRQSRSCPITSELGKTWYSLSELITPPA